jgi:hypothetical protein
MEPSELYGDYDSIITQIKNGSLMVICVMHHTMITSIQTEIMFPDCENTRLRNQHPHVIKLKKWYNSIPAQRDANLSTKKTQTKAKAAKTCALKRARKMELIHDAINSRHNIKPSESASALSIICKTYEYDDEPMDIPMAAVAVAAPVAVAVGAVEGKEEVKAAAPVPPMAMEEENDNDVDDDEEELPSSFYASIGEYDDYDEDEFNHELFGDIWVDDFDGEDDIDGNENSNNNYHGDGEEDDASNHETKEDTDGFPESSTDDVGDGVDNDDGDDNGVDDGDVAM